MLAERRGAKQRGGAAIKTTCVGEKSLSTAAGRRRPLPEGSTDGPAATRAAGRAACADGAAACFKAAKFLGDPGGWGRRSGRGEGGGNTGGDTVA